MIMLPEKTTRTTGELKTEYIKYYTDVPVQKYAAMFIGRDEDTIIRWRKEDQDFADGIQRAKAEWVRKRVIVSKAEFALERLEKDIFARPTEEALKLSTYELAVQNNVNFDPNAPRNKEISDAILNLMMEMTKAKPLSVQQTTKDL